MESAAMDGYMVLDKANFKHIPDLKLDVREKCAKLLLDALAANFKTTASTDDPKALALRFEHDIFTENTHANVYKVGISHKIAEIRRLTTQGLPLVITLE